MAIYNEILAPRYAKMMQQLLSMKGEQAVKQLSGEIMAVFPLFLGREARILEGWNTYAWITAISAGGAGNFSVFRFRNPIGSNVVQVIEKLYALSNNVGVGQIFYDPTVADQADLTTVAGPQTLDQRNANGLGHSVAVLSSKNNTVAGGAGTQVGIFGPFTGNTPVDFIITDIQELPLLPGSFYDIVCPTANSVWEVGVVFRERVLEPSELRG